MATGGMVLEPLHAKFREKFGLDGKGMALRVLRVGQYGPHAAAKNAGFREGDILVSFDGKEDLHREQDLLAHALTKRKAGDKVKVEVIRGGKRQTLTLPMQE
jgi:S1-C subfamily serine protease